MEKTYRSNMEILELLNTHQFSHFWVVYYHSGSKPFVKPRNRKNSDKKCYVVRR